tara:strand:- start:1510 stop:2805 length:1296 start_codon:yes stop_codon:yes gene_type:complete
MPGPQRILFITADDLGWKDLSSAGNPNLATPNLDRLLAGGVSFERAFDVTSTCASSRTTYATGQYPHTHGVTALVHRMPELSLPPGTPTLASHLRDAGYLTGIEGKFHLAFPTGAEEYGYDDVRTSLLAQKITDTEETLDFLRVHADEPWFFEVNYMNPHRNGLGEFQQHEDHPVDPAAIVIPATMRVPDVEGAREEIAAYYSQVERMDAMIGEVVAELEALGQLDDTLVVFISDNGSPFPQNKLSLYDRGTGTPLFFHWPAALPAGVSRTELVSSVDLMPTILELAEVPIPDDVEGASRRSLLAATAPGAPVAPGAVFGEMTRHIGPLFPMRSVRTDRYRYVRNYSAAPIPLEGDDQPWVQEVLADLPADLTWGEPRVPEELYDLESDPHESTNLLEAGEEPAALAELRTLLDEHMARTADPYLGQPFES